MNYHSHHEDGCHQYWLHFGKEWGRTINLEWSFGWRFGADIKVGGGDNRTIQFHLGLLFFSVWLTFDGFWNWKGRLERLLYDGRETGISIHDWTLRVNIWAKEMEWSRRWREVGIQWHWTPADFFLGRWKNSSELVEKKLRHVYMPEAAYRIEIEIRDDYWRRRYFPFLKKIMRRAHVECLDPIPHPGKGTTSYNCGEDATYGSTFPCKTVDEAVAHMFTTSMKSRERYGNGERWVPQEKHTRHSTDS